MTRHEDTVLPGPTPGGDPSAPDPDEAAAGGALYDPQLEGDLAAELELAREQAAKHLEVAQRVQAEFENFRKRVARDAEEQAKRAGQRIVEELLPVLDNLERAIDHTTAGGDVEQLLAGVEMVHQQMLDVLAKEGVSVQDPFGQPFDPARHQAVGRKEDADVPDHTVVDVYQKGYEMGGKVVRPAMVVVSTGGPAGSEA
ncbi:MAG: nucleotide exchange factor GrpE [Coriobacteriia bacterium]|nr:nucleotide exchange factor GrpE [Coriobacteriia bacterium]